MGRSVVVCESDKELHDNVKNVLTVALSKHLSNSPGKPFIIGFSGGSMPKVLIPALKEGIPKENRSLVRLFPVDERLVPLNDPENNTNAYLEGLKGVFEEQQFAIVHENEDGQKAAKELKAKLEEWSGTDNGFPRMNILFLGMGPDGHTCSLFPNHPLLNTTNSTVELIEDSPKPPPRRVTLTLSAVNSVPDIAFIATGQGKAAVLKEIFVDKSSKYPSGLVNPQNGSVQFFLDTPAASLLPKPHLLL